MTSAIVIMMPYHQYPWNNDIIRNICLSTYKYVAGKSPGCAKSKSRHYAVFCVSSFLKLNLKSRPEVFKGARKPNPARQTNLKLIRHGLSKVLLNVYKFRRNDKRCLVKKLWFVRRIIMTTINHLQDGICHHGGCQCFGAKQAPGHQQPPCCKYRLFTRLLWKLICEDNMMYVE